MSYNRTHHHIECDVQDCHRRVIGGGNETPADIRLAAKKLGWTSSHSMLNAMADIGPADICQVDHDA